MTLREHIQNELVHHIRQVDGIKRVGHAPGGHATIWGYKGYLGSLKVRSEIVRIRVSPWDARSGDWMHDIDLANPELIPRVIDIFRTVAGKQCKQ